MSNTSNNNYNSKFVIAVITIAIFTRLFEAIPLISIWRIPVKGEEEHNIGVPSSTDFLLVMQKEERVHESSFTNVIKKTKRILGREMNGSS